MEQSKYYDNKIEFYNIHNINRFGNPIVLNMIPNNSVVFDIGCNTGNLARGLTEKKDCTVYGIDISPKALKIASKYLKKSKAINLSNVKKLPYSNIEFDYVVLADVLEHLNNPFEVLKKIRKQLTFKYLIVSLPNVAFISVRAKLLLGKFDYTDQGIMDESHVKFYTLKSTKKLFEKCGFRIVEVKPFPLTNKKLSFLTHPLTRSFPTLFGRQLVFVLKKK